MDFSLLYTGLGERDAAVVWLRKAYEERLPLRLARPRTSNESPSAPMIESILLSAAPVATFIGQKQLTNASGFFFERDDRLFLVSRRRQKGACALPGRLLLLQEGRRKRRGPQQQALNQRTSVNRQEIHLKKG